MDFITCTLTFASGKAFVANGWSVDEAECLAWDKAIADGYEFSDSHCVSYEYGRTPF